MMKYMSEVFNARIRDANRRRKRMEKIEKQNPTQIAINYWKQLKQYCSIFFGPCGNHIFEKIEITRRVSECAAIGSPTKK